jgi:hypothetical protein
VGPRRFRGAALRCGDDQLGVDIRDIDPALRETVAADRAHSEA